MNRQDRTGPSAAGISSIHVCTSSRAHTHCYLRLLLILYTYVRYMSGLTDSFIATDFLEMNTVSVKTWKFWVSNVYAMH